MKIAQIGNFEPSHSTENELRKAALSLGHDVTPYQENRPGVFRQVELGDHDLVLWTRTGWNPPPPETDQLRMLLAARAARVPTVGFHLDRWFGLHREHQVDTEPFFRCEVVFTADGGHQDDFTAAGVSHHWLPPAISEFECGGGSVRPEFMSDVAFVGSWQPGYHAEWTHRPDLVAHLRDWYGPRVKFWPSAGQPAVREQALRDLYASTLVNVGDSCLVNAPNRYWSDRIPETLGRGGFLLHPYVEGIEDHFTDGEHLRLWQVGDWAELHGLIDHYLAHPDERARIAAAGRAHVLQHHTYTRRIEQVLAHVGAMV